ncbi:PREDICTED: mitochondrial import receptor subunit TOM5 homolog [Nipponia nippon]|uniref:mitochondrial import receptor subunit TOM5 homolog n=1 Tax=Nipponia nippon TaxID=128390 RepID=UPI00051081BC|nr:PREDICTED: mitochondrial import receptor subunit TOM5 homolog [Nipponia nippon]
MVSIEKWITSRAQVKAPATNQNNNSGDLSSMFLLRGRWRYGQQQQRLGNKDLLMVSGGYIHLICVALSSPLSVGNAVGKQIEQPKAYHQLGGCPSNQSPLMAHKADAFHLPIYFPNCWRGAPWVRDLTSVRNFLIYVALLRITPFILKKLDSI